MAYDSNNVFAKILRGEIPCNKVFENDHALAFHDISPQAPTHVLVIPKGAYVSMNDFTQNASEAEIGAFFKAVGEVSKALGVQDAGWRMIANIGADGGQEVPHLHIHICGGRKLGRMIPQG